MWGNTTMSRSGSTGAMFAAASAVVVFSHFLHGVIRHLVAPAGQPAGVEMDRPDMGHGPYERAAQFPTRPTPDDLKWAACGYGFKAEQ